MSMSKSNCRSRNRERAEETGAKEEKDKLFVNYLERSGAEIMSWLKELREKSEAVRVAETVEITG